MGRLISLTDDFDQSEGAKERHFSVGGSNYVIDLNDDNYSNFINLLEPYINVARISKQTRKPVARVLSPTDKKAIRVFAKTIDYPLADRGRFPNDLIQKYYSDLDFEGAPVLVEA